MPLSYRALGKSYLLIKTRKLFHLISVHLHNISLTTIFFGIIKQRHALPGKGHIKQLQKGEENYPLFSHFDNTPHV